jgi:hypothetical protein
MIAYLLVPFRLRKPLPESRRSAILPFASFGCDG